MSRHSVECREPEKFLCLLGWDAPLETYFAQVIDRESLDESERTRPATEVDYDGTNLVLWCGVATGELPRVADLGAAIAEWAELPAGLARRLEEERQGSRKPTPLQRRMNELFAPGSLRT
jgi:hypothetical protein